MQSRLAHDTVTRGRYVHAFPRPSRHALHEGVGVKQEAAAKHEARPHHVPDATRAGEAGGDLRCEIHVLAQELLLIRLRILQCLALWRCPSAAGFQTMNPQGWSLEIGLVGVLRPRASLTRRQLGAFNRSFC